ncbi:MAG: fused MFS/spermidine synthase [Pirellulales bacterium]|nr:fused MFS/spermidine synthase [Pirellulales bacterium]
MQLFFALTLFVSATLLFVVQPMFAKMVLPLLGGTPSVWNTCMVFYQAALLAGYLYAHFSTRWLGTRRQALLHIAVLCLPWCVLPIAVPGGWSPPTQSSPIPWLLALLAMSVGLPFFVVAASAPMLQAWFADTRHAAARDPYFLYAASNLGSMLSLLGYPVVIEPLLPLTDQAKSWAVGYGVLTMLTMGCAALMWRSSRGTLGVAESRATEPIAAPATAQRLRWLALSFAPSSLLLGVTTHLSTDVAAVPLLWVVPLALYLLTFVLVFARHQLLPHAWMVRLQPFLVLPLAAVFFQNVHHWPWAMLAFHLVVFFVTAMVCHGELAASRPPARYLTEFYIWMSVGGVLGGLFNALVAPSVFPTVIEYPLVVAVACMLRPRAASEPQNTRARRLDFALPAAVALGMGAAVLGLRAADVPRTGLTTCLILGAAAWAGFRFHERPLRFGMGILAILVVGGLYSVEPHMRRVERNFFGVVKVRYSPGLDAHVLVHGSTNHGIQYRSPAKRRRPLTYYHTTGPLGQLFAGMPHPEKKREIGVIGLGTGSISSYARPGQHLTYYEIDPAISRIALDPQFFTFLHDCPATIEIVLGDARLSLIHSPARQFDVLVVDAFSSDAIPIHLITKEALHLYLDKLAEEGILAIHISNRYLNLAPVLGKLAEDAGAVCRVRRESEIPAEEMMDGKIPSSWVIMAKRPEALGKLADDPRWKAIPVAAGTPLWTDDFSNIVTVLKL